MASIAGGWAGWWIFSIWCRSGSPVFNLADVAINLAVLFLALDFWEGQRRAGR